MLEQKIVANNVRKFTVEKLTPKLRQIHYYRPARIFCIYKLFCDCICICISEDDESFYRGCRRRDLVWSSHVWQVSHVWFINLSSSSSF